MVKMNKFHDKELVWGRIQTAALQCAALMLALRIMGAVDQQQLVCCSFHIPASEKNLFPEMYY